MEQQRKDVKVKVGGLWKNQSKDGGTYLKGPFGACDLLIIENKKKFNPKSPDFTVYLVEKPFEKQQQQQAPTNFGPPPRFNNDEMPF